jgi:hypothetical protein
MQLVITFPDRTEVATEPEVIAATREAVELEPATVEMGEMPIEKQYSVAEETGDDLFFPLEIDKDDAFIVPPGDSCLMDPAAMVAEEALEPSMETAPIKSLGVESDAACEALLLEAGKEGLENKKNPDDWLSGHLDLMSKIITERNSKPKE